MKRFILTLIATAAAISLSHAQVGYWTQAGLTPRTATIDVNNNAYNNGDTETGDISITSNTNVVLAFEDDGDGITDFEACWTLFNANGNLLIAPATITNLPNAACIADAEGLTNMTVRAFFRSDGSPIPFYAADFGGKAKGNLFGDGFGFGSAGGAIGCEIPELATIALGSGSGEDFPLVQFLNNDGTRNTAIGGPDVAGILSYSAADTAPDGDIRIADFEWLSNGNILLVGESRQPDDYALTGQTAGRVAVYKVLTQAGAVVKAYSAASSEAIGTEMWHGAAATANGFALRFSSDTGDKIRFFDNAGNPTTPNISIAAATCHPEAATGGRGDGSGFKGNGVDAYVYACSGASGPWVTVFNANGSVRYSRKVADLADNPDSGGLDAAIAADGRVIVAFGASNNDTNNVNSYELPQARLFDPCGRAIGPVFYLSERENPTNSIASNGGKANPRVAFRGSTIAAMWGSSNSTATALSLFALRIFNAPALAPCSPAPVISISQSGTNAIISYPASFGLLTLQTTPTVSPTAWTCVSPQPAVVPAGNRNTMTVPIGAGNAFFRLSQ